VRLAVDDAGAGIANFGHLVDLRPDIVKIDAGLVRGVNADVSRQALIVGFVHFAAVSGALVLAEGIETAAEQETVQRLGVTLGQGYHLARPARVEEWQASPVADTALQNHKVVAIRSRTVAGAS
jgi:EAL domain-containing protein (putative c-di-GMP-specific phosphodiesterase class I)